jgi:APA family basic amino acid/polyamine antiporter
MTVSTQQAAAVRRGQLLAVLGVGFGLAVTVGNAIGAGILRTPGTVAAQVHSVLPFLAVWIGGALYALLGANALAELGTMIPRSGGQYVFVRRGLGDFPAFVVGWSDWVSTCGTTAAVAIVVGEYAVGIFPDARANEAVALLTVALFTIVQWSGVRAGGSLQNVTSLIKAAALLAFVGACFWFGTRSPFAETAMAVEPEGTMLLPFIIALQAVIYTYDGWSAVIYFSEEVREGGRNIPRAMAGGVVTIAVIYLLLNVAFLTVVSLPTMSGHGFVAGLVAERMFGTAGANVLRVLVILVLLSAVSSNVLMAPRVLFAMAKDRLFWRGAAEVNRGGTPDVALLISSALAAGFIVTGTFETVIAKLAFIFVANYTLSFVTLFVLRRREPDAERPWKAWGHPFTTGLAIAASLTFLFGAVIGDTRSSIHAIGLLLVSVPVFFLMRQFRRD